MHAVIFGPEDRAGRPARRGGWWAAHFGCRAWHTCKGEPLGVGAAAAAPYSGPQNDVQLQVCCRALWGHQYGEHLHYRCAVSKRVLNFPKRGLLLRPATSDGLRGQSRRLHRHHNFCKLTHPTITTCLAGALLRLAGGQRECLPRAFNHLRALCNNTCAPLFLCE